MYLDSSFIDLMKCNIEEAKSLGQSIEDALSTVLYVHYIYIYIRIIFMCMYVVMPVCIANFVLFKCMLFYVPSCMCCLSV